MANVEYVQVEEMLAKRATRQSIRKQVQSEYEAYLQHLQPGQAGKLTPDKGEKPSLARDRLRSAAKRLGTPIQLRRRGAAIFFRLKDGEEKTVSAAEPVTEREVEVVVKRAARRKAATAAVAEAPAADAAPPKRGRGRPTSA